MEGLSTTTIFKLVEGFFKKLIDIRRKRLMEFHKIADILHGDPKKLKKYYVEPDCQEINPADRHDTDFLVSREPVLKKIEEFLNSKSIDIRGYNQLFILSDAGMGKTSLLAMLKMKHIYSVWFGNKDWVLKRLNKKELEEIETIPNKRDIILLLDALDEDPESYGRVKERLLEVLKATENFFKVIITCRTQFFPEAGENPFVQPGLIVLGGYICPAKYLSPFDVAKVDAYLKKRFLRHSFSATARIKFKKARELVEHIGSLRFRPMLLSYIDELMNSGIAQTQNEFRLYNAMVESWLIREEGRSNIPKEELLNACELLAKEMFFRGITDISEEELDGLITVLSDLRYVKAIDIKGRSLLNRNSFGNYRFSHHSIQEFLVVKHFIENPSIKLRKKLPITLLMAQLLISTSRFKECRKYFEFDLNLFKQLFLFKRDTVIDTDYSGVSMKGANFRDIELSGVNFDKSDMQVADFQGAKMDGSTWNEADLLGANFQGASLIGASFKKADLSWVDFRNSQLRDASLNDADLEGAMFRGANLKGVALNGALLYGADLQNTLIDVHALKHARLQGANLQGVDFQGVNFSEIVFNEADLQGANFREINLESARFEKADLSWADFKGANMKNARLQGAVLRGTDLSFANLSGAIFRNADFKDTNLENTNLQDTDLSGVKNLSIEMLLNVASLVGAKGLDMKIEKDLRKRKPGLFVSIKTEI